MRLRWVFALLPLAGFGGLPGNVLFADRSFFGVLKVIDGPVPGHHVLQHGTTLHGRQDMRIATACEPLSYFHRRGPIGDVFADIGSQLTNVAVIGLGTGAIACYSNPGQRMTFFEIDPMVERVARDPRLFSYLRNSPGEIDVVIGDGRKLLEAQQPGTYDLIIVDAFSSDSVPVHLMTREALRTYTSRLQPAGILALHISNRYLDLESVIATTSAAEGTFAMSNRDTSVPPDEQTAGRIPSHWVVASRDERALGVLRVRPSWRVVRPSPNARLWTDDYSNVVDAFIFRRR